VEGGRGWAKGLQVVAGWGCFFCGDGSLLREVALFDPRKQLGGLHFGTWIFGRKNKSKESVDIKPMIGCNDQLFLKVELCML
jgi:hypothetical protein